MGGGVEIRQKLVEAPTKLDERRQELVKTLIELDRISSKLVGHLGHIIAPVRSHLHHKNRRICTFIRLRFDNLSPPQKTTM